MLLGYARVCVLVCISNVLKDESSKKNEGKFEREKRKEENLIQKGAHNFRSKTTRKKRDNKAKKREKRKKKIWVLDKHVKRGTNKKKQTNKKRSYKKKEKITQLYLYSYRARLCVYIYHTRTRTHIKSPRKKRR